MAVRARRLIAVFDASVVVSAALKRDSIPEAALQRAIAPPWRLIVSASVEAEYREVLSRPKFDRFVTLERRLHILDIVLLAAERAEPIDAIAECPDPKDNKYLELAVAGGAAVIVTGDARHLLAMDPWRGIRIVGPAAFLGLG